MSPSSEPSEADRRQARRHDVRHLAICRVVAEDGPTLPATVIDLSSSGAGIEVPTWLPRNQELHLAFGGSANGLTVRARVRFARLANPPLWRIGCEFGQPLSDEEVALIVR